MDKKKVALWLAVLLAAPVGAQANEDKIIKVQAYSFSNDAAQEKPDAGEPCAVYLKYLRELKYQLLEATSLQGPPGVLYTMAGNKGELVLVKCGTAGGDEGGGCGGHGE